MSKVILDYGGALDYGVPAGTYYSDPAGEIEALTAKLEAAEKNVFTGKRLFSEEMMLKNERTEEVLCLRQQNAEQAAQIALMEKDAARYRWLTKGKRRGFIANNVLSEEEWGKFMSMEQAIDAAILGDSHV